MGNGAAEAVAPPAYRARVRASARRRPQHIQSQHVRNSPPKYWSRGKKNHNRKWIILTIVKSSVRSREGYSRCHANHLQICSSCETKTPSPFPVPGSPPLRPVPVVWGLQRPHASGLTSLCPVSAEPRVLKFRPHHTRCQDVLHWGGGLTSRVHVWLVRFSAEGPPGCLPLLATVNGAPTSVE